MYVTELENEKQLQRSNSSMQDQQLHVLHGCVLLLLSSTSSPSLPPVPGSTFTDDLGHEFYCPLSSTLLLLLLLLCL